MAIKRANVKLRKRDSAARRWLELSKAYRNGRLSQEEARELGKFVSTRQPSAPDILLEKD